MPFSLGRTPDQNEIECPQCGAIFPYHYSACPNCGRNLYEPEDELEEEKKDIIPPPSPIAKLKLLWKKITGQNYTAEELFGVSLDNAFLYDQLLQLVHGDHKIANRLIDFEQKIKPKNSRKQHIQNAIDRINKDKKS